MYIYIYMCVCVCVCSYISLGHFYSFVHYLTNFIMHYLVSDHTFGFVHCLCKQVKRELVRYKITCSASAW